MLTINNTQDAQRYADEENLLFMETSAKTSENVTAVFEEIGELARVHQQAEDTV